jgi:two-component system response regulator NreC
MVMLISSLPQTGVLGAVGIGFTIADRRTSSVGKGHREFVRSRPQASSVLLRVRQPYDSPIAAELEQIKIVLADDHAVVRSGLRLLLDAEAGMHVVAEAGTTDDAVRLTKAHRPEVLVLDLNMPGGPGSSSLDALPDLMAGSPGTAVVVLTMQSDPQFARSALGAGAKAYVLKEAADSELVEAVRTAAAGDVYLNPRLGAKLAATPPDPEGPPDDLTDREVEILRLIALGHTNAEIGKQLYLSVRTVESHRAHVQQKLRLTTRAELVRYAIDRGLLDDA